MAKVIVRTDGAPKSPAYSQAVKAGGLVFVSGQGPFDPVTGEIVGTTIQEQTAQCLHSSFRPAKSLSSPRMKVALRSA